MAERRSNHGEARHIADLLREVRAAEERRWAELRARETAEQHADRERRRRERRERMDSLHRALQLQEIGRMYRSLAKLVHPDHSSGRNGVREGNRLMAVVNDAKNRKDVICLRAILFALIWAWTDDEGGIDAN